MKILIIKILNKITKFIRYLTPKYWRCSFCGNQEYKEREIHCWKCGAGEMIYKYED